MLPFYTPFDGADAGVDPTDHATVDPRLGREDVRTLATDHAVMADLIVDHVSADSEEFRDVPAGGDASPHSDTFLTMSAVYPEGSNED